MASAGNGTQNFNNLTEINSTWDYLSESRDIYEEKVGQNIFWLLIVSIPFFMLWISQNNILIPSILALILSGVFVVFLPLEALPFVKFLIIFGILGTLYSIFQNR